MAFLDRGLDGGKPAPQASAKRNSSSNSHGEPIDEALDAGNSSIRRAAAPRRGRQRERHPAAPRSGVLQQAAESAGVERSKQEAACSVASVGSRPR